MASASPGLDRVDLLVVVPYASCETPKHYLHHLASSCSPDGFGGNVAQE